MGSAQQREFGVRPSKRESQMKGRGLVLHEPTRTWAALSLPTAGCRDRAGGPRWGACGHQVPKRLTSREVCSPLGTQGTCSGPAAGSGGVQPRLGAVQPLMVSTGHTHADTHVDTCTHTHRQVPRVDLDPPLPQSTTGTEAQSGGQAPQMPSPSPGTLAVPSPS